MSNEDSYQQIDDTLKSQSIGLKFPPELEAIYSQETRQNAIADFLGNFKYIALIFIFLGLGISLLVDVAEVYVWMSVYLSMALIITAAYVCSRIRSLDSLHEFYIMFCACVGLILACLAPSLYVSDRVIFVGIVSIPYAVVVVYTMIGLRFVHAAALNAVSYLLVVGSVSLFPLNFYWFEFHQAFIGSNILGMGLAYLYERRIRTLYLQAKLLKIERSRAEKLAQEMEALALEQEIMSKQDALTGIANRRHFDEKFEEEWRRAERNGLALSLMLLDIDFFKDYNDHYGHQKGDECLVAVAQIIQQQTQRSSDIVARYGGEEFIFLFPETDEEAIKLIAGRTVKAIERAGIPHVASAISNVLTASIGVVTMTPGEDNSREKMVKAADVALYLGKENGRNQWRMAEPVGIMH